MPRRRARTDGCAIDPSLARGLSYYTGAIVEVAVSDLAGSLGGGGRYDNLVGMFSGQSVPACGFLARARTDHRGDDRARHVPRGARCRAGRRDGDGVERREDGDALALARDLRAANCAAAGCASTCILRRTRSASSSSTLATARFPTWWSSGDDELAQGTVTIKNMRTGEQKTVPREKRLPPRCWKADSHRLTARRSWNHSESFVAYTHLRRLARVRGRSERRAARMGAPRARSRRR